MLGRTFLPEEDNEGSGRVVILSHAVWQQRFGSDPGIVGQSLALNNQAYTVVGVMPASFQFPVGFGYLGKVLNDPIELYVPLAPTKREAARGNYSFFAIGQLKPGATIEQARAEMTTIEGRLEQQYPDTNTGIGVSLVATREQTVKEIRPALLVLFGAVSFLLLIACANIAEPFAGARSLETEGVCDTRCSGREPRASLAALVDGKPDPFACGRLPGIVARALEYGCARGAGAGQPSEAE